MRTTDPIAIEDFTGEVDAGPSKTAGPVRWGWRVTLGWLPWLVVLFGVACGLYILGWWWLIFPVDVLIGFWSILRVLERLRDDLLRAVPDAPGHAALLFGGGNLRRRDIGLAWIDDHDLRFIGGDQHVRIERRELTAVRYHPIRRELEIQATIDGQPGTLHLGATLAALRELPRFARALARWRE